LSVLVRGLPPGSATWRAVTGQLDYWSRSDQLLAAVYDGIRILDWRLVSIYGKGKPPPAPEPLERPGIEPPARTKPTTVISIDEARRRLPGIAKEVNDGG
jgi:hypothetical protein